MDKRAAEIVRPPPTSLARDMVFAKLQSRILSAAEAVQAAKLRSEMLPEQQAINVQCRETWHWHVLDAQVTDRTATECAMEDGHGVTAWCYAGTRVRDIHVL